MGLPPLRSWGAEFARRFDGSSTCSHCCTIGFYKVLLAVVDFLSPISVADARLFDRLGIDTDNDEPLYEVPLTGGGGFGRIPVYAVELLLKPPASSTEPPLPWTLHLGARTGWHLPFAVLLGQRGWFDQFPTTIDGHSTTVELYRRLESPCSAVAFGST